MADLVKRGIWMDGMVTMWLPERCSYLTGTYNGWTKATQKRNQRVSSNGKAVLHIRWHVVTIGR
jgi:hypothetical protein